MGKYHLDTGLPLREVYLAWLIALDNKEFEAENNLTWRQLMAFRTIENKTWGDWLATPKEGKEDK